MSARNKMSYPAGRFLPIRLVISFYWGGVVKNISGLFFGEYPHSPGALPHGMPDGTYGGAEAHPAFIFGALFARQAPF